MAKTLIGFYTTFMGTSPLFKEDIVKETETEYTFMECGWLTFNKNEIFPTQSASVRDFIERHPKDKESYMMKEMERRFQIYKEYESHVEILVNFLKEKIGRVTLKYAMQMKKEHNLHQLSKGNVRWVWENYLSTAV